MADIAYTKPTWVNGSTVPISAANLQAISDAVDALADRAWVSTTATGGEDGNGGQPPAPKPTDGTPAGGANAQGKFIAINQNSDYTLPAGGTWIVAITIFVNSTGVYSTNYVGSDVAGGTTISSSGGTLKLSGFVWRKA